MKRLRQIFKNPDLIFFFAMGMMVLLAIILCNLSHNKVFTYFDIDHKSNIGVLGDAFNGLTAPFISLISAFLIYITFKAQNKANEKQVEANKMLQSQWQFDTYLKLFTEIRQSYEGIRITYGPVDALKTRKGKKAVDAIAKYNVNGKSYALTNIILVNDQLVFMIEDIIKTKFNSPLLLIKMLMYYTLEMESFLDRLKAKLETEESTNTNKVVINSIDDLKEKMDKLKLISKSETKNRK